ncbi:hypothetical protein [Streptomyces sp. NPDC056723]|uniref:hypothetical protein n=1 Tax=Streptomyces sp. NPDC056723 TaxID=3345925 RepID=UPI0036C1BD72
MVGSGKTLRRKSFRVLSSVFTIGFTGVAVGAGMTLSDGLDSGAFAVMAACLCVVTLARRIWCSRIILEGNSITLINPLFTYIIPYREIGNAQSDKGGTLVISTRGYGDISCIGFGGSLIDSMVGSTDRAVEIINARLKTKYKPQRGVQPQAAKRITFSPLADLCFFGALSCVVAAVIIGVGGR